MEQSESLLVAITLMVVLGTSAQWVASRLRLPSILFLLAFGIIAGPVSGLIRPDQMLGATLFPLVSLAVAVILFEGSLNLRFRELGDIAGPLASLLTVGVVVTWVCATLSAHWILDFGWWKALLLGAILVVTGPTVIGPLLRQIRPEGRVGSIARWEGIIIDPIGAVLAVLVFEAGESILTIDQAALAATIGLLKTVAAGTSVGAITAVILGELIRRHQIPDYLESAVTLTFVVSAFTISNLMQPESGLVAVTIMGVILTNLPRTNIQHILEFKENLSVLLISTLFILLSARLQFSSFGTLGGRGVLFLALVILIIRPLSVWISTMRSTLTWQEKVFLSWFAPRGIVAASVSSVFALRMGPDGAGLVPATFLVIIGTVVIYGFTAQTVALRLGLAVKDPQGLLIAGAHAGVRAIATALQNAGFTVLLVDRNHWNIQSARMEGLVTHEGDILSERLMEQLNLGGIGRFLAMTPNDEVNSLAAIQFGRVFGRSNVYQLPPRQRSSREAELPKSMAGRFLFGDKITADVLDERFERGATVKVTKLTPEFDFQSFRQHYGATALPLFVLTENGRLEICTETRAPAPKPGQSIVALVDAVSPSRGSEAGAG